MFSYFTPKENDKLQSTHQYLLATNICPFLYFFLRSISEERDSRMNHYGLLNDIIWMHSFDKIISLILQSSCAIKM